MNVKSRRCSEISKVGLTLGLQERQSTLVRVSLGKAEVDVKGWNCHATTAVTIGSSKTMEYLE